MKSRSRNIGSLSYLVFVVCWFVSLLSHFWLIHFFSPAPVLSTISRPLSSSMCSITPETANVGSTYNRIRGPGIGCWFSDHSNCSHWSSTLTFTLTSYWSLYNYAVHAADILTPTTYHVALKTSAAVLPRCLSDLRAIGEFWIQSSWLLDFMRPYDKTSYRILKRDLGCVARQNHRLMALSVTKNPIFTVSHYHYYY